MKKLALVAAVAAIGIATAGCTSSADVASHNLSKEADSFQIPRQIVFYNGITGKYIAEFDGLCSIGNNDGPRNVSVTCKVGPDKYIKNYLGTSDNVTWFALQTSAVPVSTSHYKVIFKPSTVIPDFDLGNAHSN